MADATFGPGTRVYIYLRISQQKDEAIARQRRELVARVKANGWDLAGEYVDDGISAFTGKHRPGFEAMLTDAAAGGCDVILAWHLDRLGRRMAELQRLIDLYDVKGVPFVTLRDSFDLTTNMGRLIAQILVAIAEMEVRHKVERQKAAYAYRRENEAGAAHHWPHRPFGFLMDATHHATEAAILVTIYARWIAGDSLGTIAQWLTLQGLTTPRGNQWTSNYVRELLQAERNKGTVTSSVDGVTRQGAWVAIVDDVTYARAQQLFERRPGAGKRGPKRAYLASGHVLCGACGQPMTTQPAGTRAYRYICRPTRTNRKPCGKVACVVSSIDPKVEAAALEVLTSAVWRDSVRFHIDSSELDAAQLTLDTIRGRRKAIARMVSEGLMDEVDARDELTELRDQATEAQKVRDAALPSQTWTLAQMDPSEIEGWWRDQMTPEVRRAVVAEVLRPIVIRPATKRGPNFDPSRLTITTRPFGEVAA